MQFYIIHDDELGQKLKQALIDKAREGVRVYVLYDELGSKNLSADLYRRTAARKGPDLSVQHDPRQGKSIST